MYLSKKASRYLAISLVALFFVVAVILIRTPTLPKTSSVQSKASPTPTSSAIPSPSPSPVASDALVTLTEFHRSEVKDGKKIWEIKATRGEYLAGGSAVRISGAVLWLYRAENEVVQLKAKQALMRLVDATLREAELSGDVELTYGKLTVTTQKAFYNPEKNSVTAPGVTRVQSDIFDTTGEELSVDVASRKAVFSRNVHSRVKPRGKNAH